MGIPPVGMIFSTVGMIFSTVGMIFSTVGMIFSPVEVNFLLVGKIQIIHVAVNVAQRLLFVLT